MSGNINDTDIQLIKRQVNELINDIDKLQKQGEKLEEWESVLQDRYTQLYKTSKTLFNYIFRNYGSDKYDSVFFNTTLNLMLSKISAIQRNNVTQQDASVFIGTHLADKYFGHLKRN